MSNYNLDRFIKAQQVTFEQALSEIKAGRKRSHWMWYICPQLKSLGYSDRAIYYGIADIDEAKAYMQDSYLRGNLIAVARALLALDTSDAGAVMGGIDALKLCSCMTLFEAAALDVPEFGLVLEKFYGGVRDQKTLQILNKA